VLAPAVEEKSLLEPLAPGAPEVAAQALYAATHEWARTPDDVLRRRTTLALRGLGAAADSRVLQLLGAAAAVRDSGPPPPVHT
jgi:glycerol-3-phosphate dehydrogenase